MRRLILGFLGAGVCLLVSACAGTKESTGTCSNSAGCGGNIVGTWKITSSCVTVDLGDAMNAECPGETTNSSGLKASGTVTYAADMTYTSSFTVTGNITLTLPASCLKRNNITLTCAQLTESLQSQMMMGAGSCSTASGGGCSCKFPITGEPNSETGTYTTTGSGSLTQTQSTGETETDTYCVKGSTLTISPTNNATTSGTLTLTKQ